MRFGRVNSAALFLPRLDAECYKLRTDKSVQEMFRQLMK
jgi:hypothetical protein